MAETSQHPPDASISQRAAIEYWNLIPSTVDGMLGGFPQISRIDIQGSTTFLAKLRRQAALKSSAAAGTDSQHHQQLPKAKPPLLQRAVDCGAGIGRITCGLLCEVAETVDVVEPVSKFTDEITKGEGFRDLRERGKIGDIYNEGLESWKPKHNYDLIWNQWCLGQLTDAQLESYLGRCRSKLKLGGWIVVKENISRDVDNEDIYDETDSSVTRTDAKFRKVFEAAKLRVVTTEVQKGFPKGLFQVKTYALQPQEWK